MHSVCSNKPWRLRNVQWWICCLFLTLSLSKSCEDAVLAANARAAAFPGILTLQNGKCAARIASVPLLQVLTELERLSGARVLWLRPPDENPISADFTGLSVAEALERLLPQKNFLLVYDSTAKEARLIQIWITSAKSIAYPPLSASRVVQPSLSPAEAAGEPAADVEEEDSGATPEEELAHPQARMRMIDAALEQVRTAQSSALRAETIEMLEGYAQEDPLVRATLTQLAHDSSDPLTQRAAAAALERLP